MKKKTYIELPPGLVELGFMNKEEYESTYIKLQGGMYGNVEAALLYFIKFTEYATQSNGLNIQQSKCNPCLFFWKDEQGVIMGVIIIYVDDCVICRKQNFID